MKNKILSMLLVLIFVIGLIPIGTAFAEDSSTVLDIDSATSTDARNVIASGTCGDNLIWYLYEDGEIVISGIGEMNTAYYLENSLPMPWEEYQADIYKLTILEGVTTVGPFAFRDCINLSEIVIPDSLQFVNYNSFDGTAFSNNPNNWNEGFLYLGKHLVVINWELLQNSSDIMIPEETISISAGFLTYADLHNVESIVIPNSVKYIGDGAFLHCNFTQISIPDSVVYIGDNAFSYCDNLTRFIVSENHPVYSVEDGVLFSKDKTLLMRYPAGKTLSVYTVPESVTAIGEGAFSNCDSLTEIVIPEGVISIREEAFDDCDSLTEITIPEGITILKELTFGGCGALNAVTLPNSIQIIEDVTFSHCYSLQNVYYYGTEEQWKAIQIGYGNEPLLNADIAFGTSEVTYDFATNGGVSVTKETDTVWNGNFADLTVTATKEKCIFIGWNTDPDATVGLDSYTVTEDVTLYAIFSKMVVASGTCGDNLTWVLYVDGELTISGTGALETDEYLDESATVSMPWASYESQIKKVIFEEGVTSVESGAFYASYIPEVVIPSSLTTIEGGAFRDCDRFVVMDGNPNYSAEDGVLFNQDKTILIHYPNGKSDSTYTVPDGVTTIGKGAFGSACFTEINLPQSIIEISDIAFENSNIRQIVLPNGVTTLGDYVFMGCGNLQTLTIPDSVTYLGAFTPLPEDCRIIFDGTSNQWRWIEGDGYYTISCPVSFNYVTVFYEDSIDGPMPGGRDMIIIPTGSYVDLTITRTREDYEFLGWNTDRYATEGMDKYCADSDTMLFAIWGAPVIRRGSCGEDLNYVWYEDGRLVVTGTGNTIEEGAFVSFYVTSVELPDTIESIGAYAFESCSSLSEIVLPVSLKSIEEGAFFSCCELSSVEFPEGLETIGAYAFVGTSVPVIELPGSLQSIGELAFCETGLETVHFDGTKAQWDTVDISDENDELLNAELIFAYCDVIYDYTTNGGTSASKEQETVLNGNLADLTATASKDNCDFIGWNTDPNATVGLDSYTITEDTTLYAIFSKPHVIGIALENTTLTMHTGDSATLKYSVLPEDAGNQGVTWFSDNQSVVRVVNGTVIAVGKGTATVTVTTNDGGFTAQCVITVEPISVAGITFAKSKLNLYLGETETLEYSILPDDADNQQVYWGSSNSAVAGVRNGVVTARSIGTAQIIVTTEDGGYSAVCEVTVLPVPVTGLEIDDTLSVAEGATKTIAATVLPENATDKTIMWTSNDESIATVENGVVTGVNAGTTVIIAKANAADISKYCVVTVTPSNVPVTGISFNKTTMELVEGDSEQLEFTLKPVNATNKNITWSSSNPSVATVINGEVTGVAPGTAVIVATTEDGGHIATCIVTVVARNQEVVSAPLSSVLSGYVKENTSVILLTKTANADIYYTLDGSVPSKSSTKYTAPITITKDTRIKVIAVKSGMQDSNIVTFDYQIADPNLPFVNVLTRVQGEKGDIVTVSVNTTENSGMAGGSFNLVYDNTAVELISVKGGSVISNALPQINDTYRENQIRVVWAGYREISSGGEILNVQFKILDTDKEAAYFSLEKVKMRDAEGELLNVQSSDGILSIVTEETSESSGWEYDTQTTVNSDRKSVTVNVYADSNQDAKLMVAVYEGQNKLVQIASKDITCKNGSYTLNFDQEIAQNAIVRVFVWDALGNVTPLSVGEVK